MPACVGSACWRCGRERERIGPSFERGGALWDSSRQLTKRPSRCLREWPGGERVTLVTGGTGFVGAFLVKELIRQRASRRRLRHQGLRCRREVRPRLDARRRGGRARLDRRPGSLHRRRASLCTGRGRSHGDGHRSGLPRARPIDGLPRQRRWHADRARGDEALRHRAAHLLLVDRHAAAKAI